MTKILNLTPHTITLCGKVIASSGLARCVATTTQVGDIDGIPVNKTIMGDVTDLPAPQQDTIYIVSKTVADAVKGKRNDVFIVDKTIRNDAGQIIGCQALAVV